MPRAGAPGCNFVLLQRTSQFLHHGLHAVRNSRSKQFALYPGGEAASSPQRTGRKTASRRYGWAQAGITGAYTSSRSARASRPWSFGKAVRPFGDGGRLSA